MINGGGMTSPDLRIDVKAGFVILVTALPAAFWLNKCTFMPPTPSANGSRLIVCQLVGSLQMAAK